MSSVATSTLGRPPLALGSRVAHRHPGTYQRPQKAPSRRAKHLPYAWWARTSGGRRHFAPKQVTVARYGVRSNREE